MNSKDAIYTGFQFEAEGYPAFAVINSDLKKMPDRMAYRYAVFIELTPDSFNENGHPEGEEYEYLGEVEANIIEYLEGQTDTLHVGHTTQYRKREIIFYTKTPDAVESFLDVYLQSIERAFSFDITSDPEWEQVSGFYDLL